MSVCTDVRAFEKAGKISGEPHSNETDSDNDEGELCVSL